MRVAVLEQAALPTARAIRWTPLVGVSGSMLVVLLLARSSDRPAGLVLAIASAALASIVAGALHDPAADLLDAVPVSGMQRRGLRLALVLAPVLASWWAMTLVSGTSSGSGSPWPLLALAASAVAAVVWAPPHLGVLTGAFVPPLWFTLDSTVPGSGFLADVAGLWHTAPAGVLAVAVVAILAGGRR